MMPKASNQVVFRLQIPRLASRSWGQRGCLIGLSDGQVIDVRTSPSTRTRFSIPGAIAGSPAEQQQHAITYPQAAPFLYGASIVMIGLTWLQYGGHS